MLENIAFFFSSTTKYCFNYSLNAFNKLLEGNEIKNALDKMIISYGDVLDDFRSFDIEPYVIRNHVCSIKDNFQFKDFPYCILIEGIDSEIRKLIDLRLIKNDDYIGCTSITYYSRDLRKNFFRILIKDIAVEKGIVYYARVEDEKGIEINAFENKQFKIKYEQFDNNVYKSPLLTDEVNKKINDCAKKIPSNVEIIRNKFEMGFKLNMEVRIATSLIWESIEKLYKISFLLEEEPHLPENSYLCIYNASQGIERLQKVLVELIIRKDNYFVDDESKLFKLLYSHNHVLLKKYIDNYFSLENKTNKLVEVLSKFYNSVRYTNYSKIGEKSRYEFYTLLRSFGTKSEKYDRFDLSVKNSFGKALGLYTRFLYKKISEISRDLEIYTNELEGDSYGMHVIYCENVNLYQEYVNVQISKKEFILKLIRDEPKYIKELNIEPLPLDDTSMIDFLSDFLVNDNIKIYDEINECYDELANKNHNEFQERIELMKHLFEQNNRFTNDD